MRISEDDLRGKTVIAADGQAIGQIISLALESETWSVEAVQVALRRPTAERLGAPRSIFQRGAIEIPVRLVQSVGDAVVLSVPVDGLRQLLPPSAPTTEAQP
jgi:sporulation protein YlmC with PRC-barrel domain